MILKKVNKILAFCIIGVSTYSWSFAQSAQNAFNLNYIPPSPSAAALGKFGETPVSLNTGIPSISVPLFSYKGATNSLSLNVSLDYHAGGVRVEEIASNVGIGWALNAGGVITRTVRSLPDDLPNYGYLANNPIPTPVTNPDGTGNMGTYVKNGIDGEQDEFNFNFNGHSGKFILGGDGNPILVTKSAINIKPVYTSGNNGLPFKGFIITDELGAKYYFQDIEQTTVNLSSLISSPTYASSYYVTSIVSPSGDAINFTYNTAVNNVYNLGSESATNLYTSSTSLSTNVTYSDPAGTNSSMRVKRIKSISLPDNTEIDFIYNALSRCDLKHDSTLVEVRKKNTQTGQYNSFKLFQSYVGLQGAMFPYAPAPCDLTDDANVTNMRLRLDSVQETSSSISLQPYRFVYNDLYHLPATNSRNQDFWGFYNGSINASGHLIPKLLYYDAGTSQSYMLDGADRRVDSNAVSACALTKIIYPTGGYSQFDYESNRAGDNKLIFNYQDLHTVGFDADEDPVQTFSVNRQPDNQVINFNFRLTTWCPDLSTNCSFVFKIKSADDATTYVTETFSYSQLNTVKTAPLNLPNGNYHLTWAMSTTNSCSCNDQFGFVLSYISSTVDSTQLGGGIRIKNITNYDGVSHNNDMVKHYKYTDAQGHSTGYAAVLPSFTHDYSDCRITHQGSGTLGDPTIYVTDHFYVRTATSNVPLTYSNGGINYARVEVIDQGPANQGKEIDYFTSYKEFPPVSSGGMIFSFPFVPLQNQEWNVGLLQRQEIYDASGHILKKVQNSYVNYVPDFTDAITNYKVGIVKNNSCGLPAGVTYAVRGYNWTLNRSDKSQSTIVDYTLAGDSLVTNHWYSYDPTYYTLSKEVTTDSKGDSLASYHYYPFNYNISGTVLSAMTDANMIATPISNETWKYVNGNWVMVSADVINYSLINNLYLPDKYYTLKTLSPLAQASIGVFNPLALLRDASVYNLNTSIDQYGNTGNPLQLTKEETSTIVYLWGYNNQYPVAEIRNSTYQAVVNALGQSVVDGLNSSPGTDATIRSQLAVLRTALPNAQVTIYTYAPLAGMTSATDARGMTTYYEYDSFQRLMNIKDKDGNIVKHLDYHYQNQ